MSHYSKYRKAHQYPDTIGLILIGFAFAVVMLGLFLELVWIVQHIGQRLMEVGP